MSNRKLSPTKELKLARNDVILTNVDYLTVLSKFFDQIDLRIESIDKSYSKEETEELHEILRIQVRKLSHFCTLLANTNKKIVTIGNAKLSANEARLLTEAIDEDFKNLDVLGS